MPESIVTMTEAAPAVENKQHKSIVALEVLYSMLSAALLTQNHETERFEDKVAGFFTFACVAGSVKIMSLLFHWRCQGYTGTRLLKEHMSERKWQYTIAIAMCFVGCIILTGVNKGNMDDPPPPNLGSSIAKRLFDMAILFAVGDFNKAGKLLSRQSNAVDHAATIVESGGEHEPFEEEEAAGSHVVEIPSVDVSAGLAAAEEESRGSPMLPTAGVFRAAPRFNNGVALSASASSPGLPPNLR